MMQPPGSTHNNERPRREVVALVPAAGLASRLGKMPCSKEIMPLAISGGQGGEPVRVMADCLLHAFASAGIAETYFIIRDGKWDIPRFFGDGKRYGLNIAYLLMNLPWGTPFTLDQSWPFIRGKNVAMGFPDMQFQPRDIFTPMLERLDTSNADVVLGLMPQSRADKWDMVAFNEQLTISRIEIKQADCKLRYCWFAAVWSPRFSDFMHHYLATLAAEQDLANRDEIYVGTVLQAAMREGFQIAGELFNDGEVIDLGTTDELQCWTGDRLNNI